jgi:large subunit ribosomal protein L36e
MTRHVAIVEAKGNTAWGLGKGYKTQSTANAPGIARRKGKSSKRVNLVRSVVREVAGFAPYERRCMELLRVNKDKRALKYCKKKLGTHKRGKAKREELSNVLVEMRKADQASRAEAKTTAE